MNKQDNFQLIGINKGLSGNERRLMVCMPLLRHKRSNAIIGVLRENWSLKVKESITTFMSLEDAKQANIILNNRNISISPGNIVVLCGPHYYASMKSIDVIENSTIIGEVEWIKTNKGYRFTIMKYRDFIKIEKSISDIALDCFNEEIGKIENTELSDTIENVVLLMEGTSAVPLEIFFVRMQAYYFIDKNYDMLINYRESLEKTYGYSTKIQIDRLKEYFRMYNPNILKQRYQYFEDPTSEEPILLDNIPVVKGHSSFYKENVKEGIIKIKLDKDSTQSKVGNISPNDENKHLIPIFSNQNDVSIGDSLRLNPKENAKKIIDIIEMAKLYPDFEGVKRNGKAFGKFLASFENTFKLDGCLDLIWPDILSMNGFDGSMRLGLSNMVRHYAKEKSKYFEQEHEFPFKGLSKEFAKVKKDAINIRNEAFKTKRSFITFGVSTFPEDNIIAIVMKLLMRYWKCTPVEIVYVDYGEEDPKDTEGNVDSIDVMIQNEKLGMIDKVFDKELLTHKGYYSYVTKDLLVKLLDNTEGHDISDNTKVFVQNILGNNRNKQTLNKEQELNIRCCLAYYGGVKIYRDSEFDEIFQAITKHAQKEDGKISSETNILADDADSFDYDFEQFITGRKGGFLGGAIHAKFIERWWIRNGENQVFRVLSPKEFEKMFDDYPFVNRIHFCNEMLDEDMSSLRDSIANMITKITIILHKVANTKKHETAEDVMKHLSALITTKSYITSKKTDILDYKWSVITNTDDLRNIVINDNDFSYANERKR